MASFQSSTGIQIDAMQIDAMPSPTRPLILLTLNGTVFALSGADSAQLSRLLDAAVGDARIATQHDYVVHADGSTCEDGCDQQADPVQVTRLHGDDTYHDPRRGEGE
jgi:hypothetical protein